MLRRRSAYNNISVSVSASKQSCFPFLRTKPNGSSLALEKPGTDWCFGITSTPIAATSVGRRPKSNRKSFWLPDERRFYDSSYKDSFGYGSCVDDVYGLMRTKL